MNYVPLLTEKIAVMFIIIFLGFFLYRRKFYGEGFIKGCSRYIASVISPIIIFNSFTSGYSAEKSKSLLLSMSMGIVIMLFSIIITGIFLRDRKYRIERFGSIFSNCGFIGIPLVSATFGPEAVFYTSPLVAISTLFCWTYGVYLITGDKSLMSLQKVIKNPSVIAFLAGMAVFYLRIPLPYIITDAMKTISDTVFMISSLIIGASLADVNLKNIKNDLTIFIGIFFRMVLIPVTFMFILKLLPEELYLLKYALLVTMATPVGANISIITTMYGEDREKAGEMVCISSLLCIITIPLIVTLSAYVW